MPLRYKPLDPNTDEIRLLRRLPSKDSVLHFTLETFSLSTAPPFWAFSYVWGNSKKTSRIVVNNHNFEATENLVAALTTHVKDILELGPYLPHRDFLQVKYLWADAVCINQEDVKERSHQVSRMHDIYQTGIVCIYLNTSDRDAYTSVGDTLRQLSKDSARDSTSSMSASLRHELLQFFSKDWFHRVWMIQEFVLAKSEPLLLFLGGYNAIDESSFRDAAWRVFQQSPSNLGIQEEGSLLSGIKQFMCLAEVKDRLRDGRECSFLTLLWTFRDRLASDPRDKVYSLLGLLQLKRDDGEGNHPSMASYGGGLVTEELIVDYAATVEDVYSSLVKSIILGTDSLNILCACQSRGRFERSWVPDWTESWSRFSLLTNSVGLIRDSFPTKRFNSSLGQKPVVEFAQNLRSISVGGTLHSTVFVLGVRPPGCFESGWIMHWFDEVEEKLKVQMSSMYKIRLEDVSETLVLSVCATNTDDDSFLDSEALGGEYSLPYSGASFEWNTMVRAYRECPTDEEEAKHYMIDIRIAQMLDGRKVFIGENGYCGLVPDHAELGDLICILFGCDVPVVLRREVDHYTFIGECYVRGLMYGEGIEALQRGEVSSERFEIY